MKDVNILTNNGVNVAQSLELFGDMEMYDETLVDFLDMVDKKLNNLEKYKLASDMPNYAIEVHSLKSDARYLGFTTLADLSYQSEMKSKAGDIIFVQDNHPKIMDEAKRMIDVSKQYMGVANVSKPAEPQVYIPTTGMTGSGNPDNPQKLQTVVTGGVVENTSDPMAQVLGEAANTQVVPAQSVVTPVQPVMPVTPAPVQPVAPVAPVPVQPVAPVPVQPVAPAPVMPAVAPAPFAPVQPVAAPAPVAPVQPVAAPEPTIQFFNPDPMTQALENQSAPAEPTIQFFTPDPMTQALSTNGLGQPAPENVAVPSGPKEGTILVVDDSNLVANFVKKIFDVRYDVIIASDGQKAIDIVSDLDVRSKIKACLLDLNMPNVDGYAVLEHFKQNGVFVKMPVAVISGVEDLESIDRVNVYPIVDILAKPFNERDVQRVVEKCLATYF